MTVEWEFDVREFPKELRRTDYKDFFRVYLSPAIMQTLGLGKGDPCKLKISGSSVGTALVWETNKGTKTKEIQIPRQLLSLYSIDSRGKVSLSKIDSQLPTTNSIILCEARLGESTDAPLMPCEHKHWAWLLEHELYRAETISPGMIFEDVSAKGQKRSFKIQIVNGSRNVLLHRFQADCEVQVVSDATDCQDLVVPQGGLGGLEAQIKELNEYIATYGRVENVEPKPLSFPSWRNGIILHGPQGTGKSLLLRRIGEAGWRTVFKIDTDSLYYSTRVGEKIAAIRKLFANARSAQPSVILIDDLTHLIGNHDSQLSGEGFAVSEMLRHEMGRLGDSRTLVVATTRSLTSVDQALRRVHGFSTVIELPVPDTHSRALILKVKSGIPKNDGNARIENIASRTHGFVGADLEVLLDVATKVANNRTKLDADRSNLPIIERIVDGDIDLALREVKPAAIRDVFVETTETRWSDIGGQEAVKHFLDRALCRPSKVGRFWAAYESKMLTMDRTTVGLNTLTSHLERVYFSMVLLDAPRP